MSDLGTSCGHGGALVESCYECRCAHLEDRAERARMLERGAVLQAEHFLAQREQLRGLLAQALAWVPSEAQALRTEIAKALVVPE